MEQLKKILVFFDQDFEAVIKKIPLDDTVKKVMVDSEKNLDHFKIIMEKVDYFFEEVKKDEDSKALMAKYEIENENLWFLFAFSIHKVHL